MSDQSQWNSMYLGAFAALLIPNAGMAKDLAELTRSDFEAIEAIGIMRKAREGDRIWPALEYLRGLRRVANMPMTMVNVTSVPGKGGACFEHRDVGAQLDCSMCGKPGNVGSGGAGGKAP